MEGGGSRSPYSQLFQFKLQPCRPLSVIVCDIRYIRLFYTRISWTCFEDAVLISILFWQIPTLNF